MSSASAINPRSTNILPDSGQQRPEVHPVLVVLKALPVPVVEVLLDQLEIPI